MRASELEGNLRPVDEREFEKLLHQFLEQFTGFRSGLDPKIGFQQFPEIFEVFFYRSGLGSGGQDLHYEAVYVLDMEIIRTVTKHVTGIDPSHGGSGDPSPFTALTVLAPVPPVSLVSTLPLTVSGLALFKIDAASFTAVTLTAEAMLFELKAPSLTVKVMLRVAVLGLSLLLA